MSTVTDAQTLLNSRSKVLSPLLKFLEVQDSAHGVGRIKFWQHLATILGPKLAVSRSLAEAGESTFLEVAEALLIYHAAPKVAQHLFIPLFKGALKDTDLTQAMYHKGKLTQAFADKGVLVTKKIHSARAATLIAAFATTAIAGEYSLTFLKNLFTQKVFQKSSFTDMVNLSQCDADPVKTQKMTDKAHRRILQCLGVASVMILGALGLAKFGHKVDFLTKTSQKLVKTFDFEVCDKNKLGLSRNFFYPLLATCFVAYMDSSRDRLERLENAQRLTVTMSSLAFGNEGIQKLMTHFLRKNEDYQAVLGPNNKVLTLSELVAKAQATGPDKMTHFKNYFKAKTMLATVPLAFAIAIPGLGVGILNRILTARRYERAQKQQLETRTQTLPHSVVSNTARPMLPKPLTGPVTPFSTNWPRPNYYSTWTPQQVPMAYPAGYSWSPWV